MKLIGNKLFYCPNVNCDQEKLKEGEICPKCRAPSKEFGWKDVASLLEQKKFQKKIDNGSKEILISDVMTEEEIKQKINRDMMNLAMHEAGTGWMRLGTLLSGNSTDQMLGAGFKALIDQNKIIIRQNELILRSLKRALLR